VGECDLRGSLLGPRAHIDLMGAADETEARNRLLEGLAGKGPPTHPAPFPGHDSSLVVERPVFPGEPRSAKPNLFAGVPRLPANYIVRAHELGRLKESLLNAEDQPGPVCVSLTGMGGSGKSVLAVAAAQDPDVWQRYPNGVAWLTLGRNATLTDRQAELARVLGDKAPIFDTWQGGRNRLNELTRDKACLVVLDDVWEEKYAEAFARLGENCCLLVTARRSTIAEKIGAHEIRIEELAPEAAMELLAQSLDSTVAALPTEASAIARECGYLPLALATVGSQIRRGRFNWGSALAALRRADLKHMRAILPEYDHDSLLAALEASIGALSESEAAAFRDLAVFPEDIDIPQAALEVLWELYGFSQEDAADLAQSLVDASLLTRVDQQRYRLHDLYYDYLRATAGDPSGIHRRLVNSYRSRCTGIWHSGPDDGYFFQRFPYHLMKADRREELTTLLLEFGWLQAKLDATDVNALLGDFELAGDLMGAGHVRDALRLAAHVLARDKSQLRSQLHARLDRTVVEVSRLLEQLNSAAMGPWLRLVTQTLATPTDPLKRIFDEKHRDLQTRCLAVMPHGNSIVSGGKGGIRIWDLVTGEDRMVLQSDHREVKCVAVSADGTRVIAASGDGAGSTVWVWNCEAGITELVLEERHDVKSLAVTPDGRHLVVGTWGGLGVWDLSNVRPIHDIEQVARAVVITPDGRRLVSRSFDKICVWDLVSGQFECAIDTGHSLYDPLVLTPDGKVVVTASNSPGDTGRYRLSSYDLRTGQELRTFDGHNEYVTCLAVTPDGTRLVSGSGDGTVRVWRIAVGELESVFEHAGARSVAVTPDGRSVISAGYDDTVRIWDLHCTPALETPARHKGQVRAVAFSPDGTWAVSGGADRVIRLWDTTTCRQLRGLEGHSRDVFAVAVTPDGRQLITGGLDDTIRVWDVASSAPQWEMEGHNYCVRGLAVTPDGSRAVSGAEDSTLGVWNLSSGERLSRFPSDAGEVQAIALTPDGTRVVFCDQGRWIHVMDLATGTHLLEISGHRERAWAVVVTRDGTRVVSGSLDGTVRIWDLRTGDQLSMLVCSDAVRSVALSGDERLVIGVDDGTVQIWDLQLGRVIASFSSDTRMMVAAVSPDGRTIAAGDYTGQVHFLRLEE
jgi:WD40 repeat protein